jgi:hypothetical protein
MGKKKKLMKSSMRAMERFGSGQTKRGEKMKIKKKTAVFLFLAGALAVLQITAGGALAQSTYFTSQGCSGCHATPVVATCNGCHAHGTHPTSAKNTLNISGITNKSSYAPGETVTVTINGGYRTGWVRVVLYDQNTVELARSTGTASGMGSSATFPATLTAPAPATPGTYTWKVAWYGNQYDASGAAFGTSWTPDPTNPNHGYEIVSMAAFTVAATNKVVTTKIGVVANGTWYSDLNGNGAWDGTPTDTLYNFGGGLAGAVPVTGDWTGNGTTKLGTFVNGTWYLDLNGNGQWDGTATDSLINFSTGIAGAIPVTGDWTGNGITKIGEFANGTWYLDLNGNGQWDGTPTDGLFNFGTGVVGAIPVTGDWTGDGKTKIGVFVNGTWYLDLNGNGIWDGPSIDGLYNFGGGLVGAVPVTGDWTGDGKTKIGVFVNGVWYLDLNGNGAWDGTSTDKLYNFGGGIAGAVPVTGKW